MSSLLTGIACYVLKLLLHADTYSYHDARTTFTVIVWCISHDVSSSSARKVLNGSCYLLSVPVGAGKPIM
ncbi:hypothetical protein PR002_g8543 [Phytophthora rubi]|uniref:Secreted protein n=1 Tax=Phytophthora rubi TaxID=129364 RepID=A0A6A3MQ44_9STRA|nr:hypothetical protein PR002_g8543 [Phytophthora rubi]